MVNSPLIRPYLLGGVALGGVPWVPMTDMNHEILRFLQVAGILSWKKYEITRSRKLLRGSGYLGYVDRITRV